jgi:aerobic-type carbon monoxide dehydrogenase small subunit (CoxS/CutS family)
MNSETGSNEITVRVSVNGESVQRTIEPRMLLADFLRIELRLTGTHVGCEHGKCGACTILFDEKPIRACLMFAAQVDGHRIRTIEGLAEDPETLHPIQQAFIDNHALQCGFCTPGLIMTSYAFLQEHDDPSETEVRHALAGNICRCTGYTNIVKAVLDAAQR